MTKVLVTQSKLDTLAEVIGGKSNTNVPLTVDEMITAADSITSGGGTPALETVTKTYTPSTSAVTDTITPGVGYDGIEEVDVTVSAVPYADAGGVISNTAYSTSNNQRKWTVTVKGYAEGAGWVDEGEYGNANNTVYNAVASGTTITPTTSSQTIGGANYMMEGAVTVSAMPSGTAGTPTATKGAVNNHAISVTPSVTNTTGYITGGTKTGTAVSVSASDVCSGSETKTANGTYDVTNLAQLVVNVSGGGGSGLVYESGTYSPSADTARPTISFSNTHSTRPFAIFIAQTSGTVTSGNSNLFYSIFSWYDAYGTTLTYGSTTTYARSSFGYRTSSSATWSGYTQTALTGSATNAMEYNMTESAFYPYTGSTSRYWRKNNTYKWIAVWKP